MAFALGGIAAWRALGAAEGEHREIAALRAAAWIALLLLALHSFVDYPLRTTSLLAVAGLLAAVVVPVPERKRFPR